MLYNYEVFIMHQNFFYEFLPNKTIGQKFLKLYEGKLLTFTLEYDMIKENLSLR